VEHLTYVDKLTNSGTSHLCR